MFSNSARTALRFSLIAPNYKAGYFLDLHALKKRLIPFQICRASRPNPITTFEIVSVNDPLIFADLFAVITSGDEPYIYSIVGKDWIIYKANELTADLQPGRYYLKISDGVQTWYSMDIINIGCYVLSEPTDIPGNNFDDNPIYIDDNNPLIIN
jgi:hypothetical protein